MSDKLKMIAVMPIPTTKTEVASPARDQTPGVILRGHRIASLTARQVIERILSGLQQGRGGWIVTANVDILRRMVCDAAFGELVSRADLVVADGMPLVWASRVQGTPLPQRVAGSSLVVDLARAAGVAGRSVFLLGGDPGTAQVASQVLTRTCPGLRIAGVQCPAIGFEYDEPYMTALRKTLATARPDIVLVALGSPKQERVIAALRTAVGDAGQGGEWWIGVGISFSFLAGRVKRAPLWMQRCGLEWTHRLLQQPGRLWRRYLIDDIPFALGLLFRAAVNRWSGMNTKTRSHEERQTTSDKVSTI